jgi:hypothetical protein
MATVLQQDEIKPWAEAILHQFNGNPELINNSSQTAPTKTLGTRKNLTTRIVYNKGLDRGCIRFKSASIYNLCS